MGTFDREAFDNAFATGGLRMAEMLDGEAPPDPAPASPSAATGAPPPPAPTKPASATQVAAAEGPGFFSRLWSGVSDIASRVEINAPTGSVDAARRNAVATMPTPTPPTPWGLILGAVAGLLILLALVRR